MKPFSLQLKPLVEEEATPSESTALAVAQQLKLLPPR